MIRFSGHVAAIGSTGSGKSYSVRRLLKLQNKGVLYFNTQHEEMKGIKGVTVADGRNTFTQIKGALDQGRFVNFLPAVDRSIRGEQLAYIIDQAYKNKPKEFFLAVDEVHLYNEHKTALNKLIEVYTTGRKWGIWGVSLSVRPAIVDKTILTQCSDTLIFRTDEFEMPYFKRYNLPYEEIMSRIRESGEYSFMIKGREGLTGPYKA